MIIGGGLAGIAAGSALAEAGLRVTLLERRRSLGGRASSLLDAQIGAPIDLGQHVVMRCCTNLLDLYQRLGVADSIRFYDRFLFIDAQGKRATLGGSPLPAPLHLLPSLLRFRPLTRKERFAAMRMIRGMLGGKAGADLQQISAQQWLTRGEQTPHAIETLWAPILTSVLNEVPERAPASAALQVFREGFLKNRRGYQLGVPQVSLDSLHHDPCGRHLRQLGVEIRTGTAATEIATEGDRVRGAVLADGDQIAGDIVVCALPPGALLQLLLPKGALPGLEEFGTSPITSVHLWFDRPVDAPDHAALLGRRFHWIFHRRWESGPGRSGFQLVASASREFVAMGEQALAALALEELRDALPETRGAELLASRVLKQPHATVSLHPGAKRPGPNTAFPNLFLAGDWTDTGWPATMESAVRSGYRAAEAVLAARGEAVRFVRPDLPADGYSRWLIP